MYKKKQTRQIGPHCTKNLFNPWISRTISPDKAAVMCCRCYQPTETQQSDAGRTGRCDHLRHLDINQQTIHNSYYGHLTFLSCQAGYSTHFPKAGGFAFEAGHQKNPLILKLIIYRYSCIVVALILLFLNMAYCWLLDIENSNCTVRHCYQLWVYRWNLQGHAVPSDFRTSRNFCNN